MRIAICDDEEKYRIHVKEELENIINSLDVVIDSFAQGEDLLKKLEKQSYDIIFLDIEMPTMDGITLAKKIREQSEKIELVFLTSHVEYALEGYEVNALRYLTKPVNPVKLQEVISYMIKRDKNKKTIWVKNKEYEEKVLLTDIMYMEAQNQNVEIHTKDKVYVHRYNMGDYEKELKADGFFRIHRGYLVALGSIESLGQHEVQIEQGIHSFLVFVLIVFCIMIPLYLIRGQVSNYYQGVKEYQELFLQEQLKALEQYKAAEEETKRVRHIVNIMIWMRWDLSLHMKWHIFIMDMRHYITIFRFGL